MQTKWSCGDENRAKYLNILLFIVFYFCQDELNIVQNSIVLRKESLSKLNDELSMILSLEKI